MKQRHTFSDVIMVSYSRHNFFKIYPFLILSILKTKEKNYLTCALFLHPLLPVYEWIHKKKKRNPVLRHNKCEESFVDPYDYEIRYFNSCDFFLRSYFFPQILAFFFLCRNNPHSLASSFVGLFYTHVKRKGY